MKHYVPNLISTRHRVLPDYFKESAENRNSLNTSAGNLLWNALAIVVVLVALFVWGIHPGFGLSLVVFAFFASSWGKRRLEQALQFLFTPSLKAGVLGVLSLSSVLTGFQYKDRVDQNNERERLASIAEQKTIAESKRREALRLDSLRIYLTQADASLKKGAYARAVWLYNQSARFATANESEEQRRLHEGLATGYVRTKAYRAAIEQYDELARQGSLTGEQTYQRALCYQQTGRKSEALSDLLKASEAGYKPATKLYDKQNPLLRKLLYYQTVCCDGSDSPSNAKGRGACSHHGGVCNWNKPIYETYRKYDVNGL